jgi:threonine/homoserine/homoserine lactone efflux protein
MTLRTWAMFAATELVLCFSPGPAVLFVVGSALRHGAPASLRSNLGILSANALYFALSAAGLGALLLASYTLFTVLKWIGAAYLIWLGVRLLLPQKPGDATARERELPAPGRLYLRAAALQLANPKTLLFFVALLPQFVDPTAPTAAQFAILGVTSIALEFCVLGLYGFVAASAAERLRSPTWQRRLDLVSGGFLIGAGLNLATDSD